MSMEDTEDWYVTFSKHNRTGIIYLSSIKYGKSVILRTSNGIVTEGTDPRSYTGATSDWPCYKLSDIMKAMELVHEEES